jgi:hypothetical protein
MAREYRVWSIEYRGMEEESGEVEEEGFNGAGGRKGEGAGVFGFESVAGRELHAADLDFSADQLEPKPPALTEFMRWRRSVLEGLYSLCFTPLPALMTWI